MIEVSEPELSGMGGYRPRRTKSDYAANSAIWREFPIEVGLRDKCSYLVAVITQSGASASEEAIALQSLLDDIGRISAALAPEEYEELHEAIESSPGSALSQSPLTLALFPDEAVSGEEAIDGINVRRVIVPPATDHPSRTELAKVELPSQGSFLFVTEYTFDSDDQGFVEISNGATEQVFASMPLERGHNQVGVTAVDVRGRPPLGLRIAAINLSRTEPIYWYGSAIRAVPDASARSFRHIAPRLEKEVASERAPILSPVTYEPLTLQDIDRLMSVRDKFHGERIFIMGNGPSLNETPLELLQNDFVFGVNRISLLFDRIDWRPTFFTAFDVRVVPDNKEEFANLDVPYKFFSARYKEMLGERDGHFWYHTKAHYGGFEQCFEPTVVYSGFGGGGTVATIAIELAFFMGFRELYLVGTDVSYSIPETVTQSGADTFGDGVRLKLESTRDDDPNHFDPTYFGRGKKWHNPNVREMKIGFARAAAYVERRGGIVRNATIGGELDEVQRVDFLSLF